MRKKNRDGTTVFYVGSGFRNVNLEVEEQSATAEYMHTELPHFV
jgi:hypothetical protein